MKILKFYVVFHLYVENHLATLRVNLKPDFLFKIRISPALSFSSNQYSSLDTLSRGIFSSRLEIWIKNIYKTEKVWIHVTHSRLSPSCYKAVGLKINVEITFFFSRLKNIIELNLLNLVLKRFCYVNCSFENSAKTLDNITFTLIDT